MDAVGSTGRRTPGRRRLGPAAGHRVLRLVALAVAVGVTGACGGGDDDKSSSTSFPKIATTAFTGDPNKACTLATQAEVEAAIATPVKPGAGAQGIVCRFEVVSKPTSFVLIESNESPQASQIYDLKASSAERAENLTGVGERAYVAGDQAVILRGPRIVTVTVSIGQPQAAVTAALKKLATTVGRHA